MVNFYKLWSNHPGIGSKPCSSKLVNQCAIRMGVTLQKANISLGTFKGAKCWFKHSPKHILRAQELASWMDKNTHDFGVKVVHKHVNQFVFSGKKGLVFIKNGWGSTDHIDLWDGKSFKAGDPSYFSLGQEVWFWHLK